MSTGTEEPGTRRARAAAKAPPARTPARTRPAPARRGAAGSTAARPGPAAAARAPRMPFVLLVLGLLSGALISLLALRTVLVADSFAISELQQTNEELAHQEEGLREEVLRLESSERIAEEAEELGMRPGEAPLFMDLDERTVTGDPGGADSGLPGTEAQPEAGAQ
ncbi:hypothetical protein ACFPZ0_27010 [Streptomonospora nanhaiensis]|uniref:Cell division protein FtsB n=1 Tax=Streptomonospora nanhaiensis TaxID=1323731 RepID=A0A853BIL5_9ACTN|nr:hypothetical protein [Streptomonospora nanhaiensis]MBV2362489.1 septum formation initiator family protein [Streptomonospora nanhaiensis]NYI94850.1 cell division protein FtsB [Streptomonospora nanhaiensis]